MDLPTSIHRFKEKMGIQFPMIQAPMAGGATTVELVAAVSNAGGLGSFAAGYLEPAEIRQSIKKIRKLTTKPFAVNLFIPQAHHATPNQMRKACEDIASCCRDLHILIEPVHAPYAPFFEEQINVLIEEKIPIFSFAFGVLEQRWISHLKANQTLLIGTATTLKEAHLLKESDIDAIIAQGKEAGGHRGTFLDQEEDGLIESHKLITQLSQHVNIPIIAAGGIMNGQGITAAIKYGAAAVQLGTAFLSCNESGIPTIYKQILLSQQTDNTTLTRAFSGKLARGIRNQFTQCMENKKNNILDYPIQNALTTKMRQQARAQNNGDFLSLWAGQNAKLCRNISASNLVEALASEMEIAYARS